jgi:uncharacterized protein YxjI
MDAPLRTTDNGSRSIRYRLPQNVVARTDSVLIVNDRGETAFLIDIERDQVRISDLAGRLHCQFSGRALHMGSTVHFDDPNGTTRAVLRRSELSPVRNGFTIETERGNWIVEGQVAAYEYWMHSAEGGIAEVSCRWFRVRNTYGVQVSPQQPCALVLAAAVCLDIATSG